MATTTGTLWNEKIIFSGAPEVKSTATYEYERTGSQLKIKISTTNHCTSSGAYWDWRWAFSVSINSQQVANNIQIKPRTYLNTIGTTNYSADTGWIIVDIGTDSEVTISVQYFDTEASNNDKMRSSMGGGSYTLKGIPPLPNVSISIDKSYPNLTDTSVGVSFSIPTTWDYVRFYLDDKKYKDVYSNNIENPVYITGLKSNTKHKVSAKAYGNGGYGKASKTIEFTTFLTPSTISKFSIDEIGAFNINTSCKSSNASNTSKYEFAICDSNKNPLSIKKSDVSYYNFTGLQEETQYYVRYRVKSKDSGAWSNYIYSGLITTEADQAQTYFKKNDIFSKGKLYYKQDGQWKKVKKIYIKQNGQWQLGKNK